MNSTHQFNAYLTKTSCKHLGRIEEKLMEHREANDSSSTSWIISHSGSLELAHRNKIKLMLEFYFSRWLRTISKEINKNHADQ